MGGHGGGFMKKEKRMRRQWWRESGVREVRDDVKNFGVSD
jgi:hypothetical protein